jgi:hypothetical protein
VGIPVPSDIHTGLRPAIASGKTRFCADTRTDVCRGSGDRFRYRAAADRAIGLATFRSRRPHPIGAAADDRVRPDPSAALAPRELVNAGSAA